MLEPRRTRRHCDWERAKGGREGGGGGALALNSIDFLVIDSGAVYGAEFLSLPPSLSLAPSFALSLAYVPRVSRVRQ